MSLIEFLILYHRDTDAGNISIRDCTMTLDCLRGHRLIVVRCGGRVVCCFFCDPFICLNKSLSRVTPNITHPDTAAASSQQPGTVIYFLD